MTGLDFNHPRKAIADYMNQNPICRGVHNIRFSCDTYIGEKPTRNDVSSAFLEIRDKYNEIILAADSNCQDIFPHCESHININESEIAYISGCLIICTHNPLGLKQTISIHPQL